MTPLHHKTPLIRSKDPTISTHAIRPSAITEMSSQAAQPAEQSQAPTSDAATQTAVADSSTQTDDERAAELAAEKEYLERMEEEYAKREGGA
jgi:hypothetical protein